MADLYQVSVRVADVAPDLASMILWRGEELGAASAPICVGRRHVRDADVEKVAHPVRVTGRLERDRRLVVCRPSADVDDDPAVRERDAALRVIISGAGKVQPRIVEMVTALIRQEVQAGRYRPAIEPSTLGYAIVRLGEAFLFNDAVAGMRGDVDRLRHVQAAMFAAERPSDDGSSRSRSGGRRFASD